MIQFQAGRNIWFKPTSCFGNQRHWRPEARTNKYYFSNQPHIELRSSYFVLRNQAYILNATAESRSERPWTRLSQRMQGPALLEHFKMCPFALGIKANSRDASSYVKRLAMYEEQLRIASIGRVTVRSIRQHRMVRAHRIHELGCAGAAYNFRRI